jgi:hypothetical protein
VKRWVVMKNGVAIMDRNSRNIRLFKSKGAAVAHASRQWTCMYWGWCGRHNMKFWEAKSKRTFQKENPREAWMAAQGYEVQGVIVEITLV